MWLLPSARLLHNAYWAPMWSCGQGEGEGREDEGEVFIFINGSFVVVQYTVQY
jgi:hypothetical protein